MSDISLRDLRNDTGGVLRRAEAGEQLIVHVNRRPVAQITRLEGAQAWVEASVVERRIRAAQADPALSGELRELSAETIADL